MASPFVRTFTIERDLLSDDERKIYDTIHNDPRQDYVLSTKKSNIALPRHNSSCRLASATIEKSTWSCRHGSGIPFDVGPAAALHYVGQKNYEVFQKRNLTSNSQLYNWTKRSSVPLVVNVDGAYLPSTKTAGAGILFRTGTGKCYCSCSVYYGQGSIHDPTECEALAVRHAIQLVEQLGLTGHMYLETDSQLVSSYLNGNKKLNFGVPLSPSTRSTLNHAAADISRLKKKPLPCHIHVTFSYRERNEGADKLSRNAAYGCNTAMYLAVPLFLDVPLFEDVVGIKRVRPN